MKKNISKFIIILFLCSPILIKAKASLVKFEEATQDCQSDGKWRIASNQKSKNDVIISTAEISFEKHIQYVTMVSQSCSFDWTITDHYFFINEKPHKLTRDLRTFQSSHSNGLHVQTTYKFEESWKKTGTKYFDLKTKKELTSAEIKKITFFNIPFKKITEYKKLPFYNLLPK